MSNLIELARLHLRRMTELADKLPHGADRRDWMFLVGKDVYEQIVLAWLEDWFESGAAGEIPVLNIVHGCRMVRSDRERAGIVLVRRQALGD